jgi:NADH:ubiquinone oxidoreductase subunit 6 (subunit J)
MAVGISVGVVVLLIIIAYAAVLIFKRKQKEEHFLDIGTNTQSIVPSIYENYFVPGIRLITRITVFVL